MLLERWEQECFATLFLYGNFFFLMKKNENEITQDDSDE